MTTYSNIIEPTLELRKNSPHEVSGKIIFTNSGGIKPSIFAHNTKVPKTGSSMKPYITLP